MNITREDLRDAFKRWAEKMQACAEELNALDSRLGDGDLGVTLSKCGELVQASIPQAGDSISNMFRVAAKSCMAASGSSFGTLLAVGFLAAGKRTADIEIMKLEEVRMVLRAATDEISTRGGAKPGDKTFLDALLATYSSMDEVIDGADVKLQIKHAVERTLSEFRERPNRLGRARMFGDQSIGMDDPGMVAVLRMIESL